MNNTCYIPITYAASCPSRTEGEVRATNQTYKSHMFIRKERPPAKQSIAASPPSCLSSNTVRICLATSPFTRISVYPFKSASWSDDMQYRVRRDLKGRRDASDARVHATPKKRHCPVTLDYFAWVFQRHEVLTVLTSKKSSEQKMTSRGEGALALPT